MKFCTKANQTLLLKRLQNNFFDSCPLHGANISQIFSFTHTTEPHNIQLVPNVWNTTFHQPVKISIDFLADFASFQLVPKYILKVKVILKYFTLKQLFPWKMGAKGQISLMQIFNGDRPIMQCVEKYFHFLSFQKMTNYTDLLKYMLDSFLALCQTKPSWSLTNILKKCSFELLDFSKFLHGLVKIATCTPLICNMDFSKLKRGFL